MNLSFRGTFAGCFMVTIVALLFGSSVHATTTTVVWYGDTWKFNVPSADPGTAWRGSFDDSSWSSGAGLLGFETAKLPPPRLRQAVGSMGNGQVVYLFRKTFTFNGNPEGANFILDQVVDDGVTYYLNGTLLGSVGHVPGTWNNNASRSVGDAIEELGAIRGTANGLISGTNVLSAEVHQSGPGSSDMIFGCRLTLMSSDSLLPSDNWRTQNFGTAANSGNAADLADPDFDGIPNIAEYVLNKDPNRGNTKWSTPTVDGTNMSAVFLRRKASMSELSTTLFWANDPAGPWENTGVTEQIQADDGNFQTVKSTVTMGSAGRKFVRLKIVRIALPTVSVEIPADRMVFQRNNSNVANMLVEGRCATSATRVDARVVVKVAGQGTTSSWVTVDPAPAAGHFRGTMPVTGGWYSLEVRAYEGFTAGPVTTVPRVGVGEVFVVVGHSVGAGQEINGVGASDDRINAVQLGGRYVEPMVSYKATGDSQYLPSGFVKFTGDGVTPGVCPAPFGGGTYFWSKFAENIAVRKNVPVCIYHAAFGGTSLEYWAKSSQGIAFDGGFVNSSIHMPYVNLYNAIKKYVSLCGVRAILADQGANDWPRNDETAVYNDYVTWVDQVRSDLGHAALAIVVNRHTPFLSQPNAPNYPFVRRVQQKMIDTYPNCFPGPDYDLFDDSSADPALRDRNDYTHLGAPGVAKASTMWADALTNTTFFSNSTPWLPAF